MLIDSNIIIYTSKAEYPTLRKFIAHYDLAISAISYVEVLGYHRLTEPEKEILIAIFASSIVLLVSQTVIDEAVRLRQIRKMSLGDAIIAGTAITHDRTLATRNVKHFDWIAGLTVIDPLAQANQPSTDSDESAETRKP